MILTRREALFAAFGTMMLPSLSWAQEYPTKPIRIIVTFPAGGGTDIIARVVMNRVATELKSTLVIDNRGGAGGTIGTDALAKADPDGYTFGVVSASHAVNPSLYKNLPFDAITSFAPVTILATAPGVLVINPELPVSNVKELIALAKSKPGELDYASAGNGTPPHLAAELFKVMAGVDMNHVPYQGNGAAMIDLISGRVSLSFPTLPSALPHIRSGKLKALAVTGLHRVESLPDVPTIDEAGLKGYDASSWYAVLAPAGTPVEFVNIMQQAIAKSLQAPEVQKRLALEGLEPSGISPEEFGKLLQSEVSKWAGVVKASGAKLE